MGRARKSASVTSSKRCRAGARVCLYARIVKNKEEASSWIHSRREQTLPFPSTAELSNACACTHIKRKKQSSQKQRGVTHTIAAVETSGTSPRAARIAKGVSWTR
jgi:hypothetical protein